MKFATRYQVPAYEDKKDEGTQNQGNAGGQGTPKTFTQDELNSILSTEKKKYQDTLKKSLDELHAIQERTNLTKEERDQLAARVEELQATVLTKEELAKKELDKATKAHQKQLESLTSEATTWKSRYTDQTITNAITSAAVVNKAYNPEQIIAILRSNARLAEELDEEGKPSGSFVTKIKFQDVDDKGKSVTLELTPEETVKRMREIEKYQNLFTAEGTGGTGGTNRGTKQVDPAKAARDPEAWRKERAKLGLTNN